MVGIVNQVFRNNGLYVFLCALAGVSPLVGVQRYEWDYAALMFYYLVETIIVMLIGLWKIAACHLQATPDGEVRVMLDGKTVKIVKGNMTETVNPMDKGTALALFFTFSMFGVIFSFIFLIVGLDNTSAHGNLALFLKTQWPLFAAATAGLVFQHGYRFVSEFWLGSQKYYPPGHFMARSFFRAVGVILLIGSVALIERTFKSHFALVMAILIGARIIVQIAFALSAKKLGIDMKTPGGSPKRKAPAGQPPATIKDQFDLEEFLLAHTQDEALTRFLLTATEKVGFNGYVEVERGGNGTPYEVKHHEFQESTRTASDIQAEMQSLRQASVLAQDDAERDRIARKLAELTGTFCTIRINMESSEEFDRLKTLIMDTWAKVRRTQVPADMTAFSNRIGEQFILEVTGSADGFAYGTDIYTLDSNLPTAAVHAGALADGETGRIRVALLPGEPSYKGSLRNGVKTSSWKSFQGSYSVEKVT